MKFPAYTTCYPK